MQESKTILENLAVSKLKIIAGTVAVGILGLALSTILMEPYGEKLLYGYPFLWA